MANAECEIDGNRPDPKSKIQNPSSLSAGEVFVPSHRWPEMAVDFSVPEEAAKAARFWKEKTGTPEPGSTHELVAKNGGRFFEGPRCWQQEPHWPFAWSQAKHDWILRLDADEFPSGEMTEWLKTFRNATGSSKNASGYTCIWPLWNGKKALNTAWPNDRNFLFDKRSIRIAGMVEMVPYADTEFKALGITLHHTPKRKSFGYRNIVLRKQAYRWRRVIALSLLDRPTNLPRWRWTTPEWPQPFLRIRDHPIRYSVECLFVCPRFGLKSLLKNKMWSVLYSFPGSHWHHALICWDFLLLKTRSTGRLAHRNVPFNATSLTSFL